MRRMNAVAPGAGERHAASAQARPIATEIIRYHIELEAPPVHALLLFLRLTVRTLARILLHSGPPGKAPGPVAGFFRFAE